MTQMKRSAVCIALVGTAAFALVAVWPEIVRAFNPQPDPPGRFGMVGLARGQTARLNVVNLGSGDPPGEADPPGELCRVTLGFVDASGRPFMDEMGNEIMKQVALPAVQSEFLDLRLSDPPSGKRADPPGVRRVQIRAGIDPESERGGAVPHLNPCGNLVATLEIFDTATGLTTLVYHPPDPGMGAVGDPTGLAPGR
jgi:hypothetical protein